MKHIGAQIITTLIKRIYLPKPTHQHQTMKFILFSTILATFMSASASSDATSLSALISVKGAEGEVSLG